jgi:HK97 family phage major capsid protein
MDVMRLNEIKERKKEIRAILKSDKFLSQEKLDEIERELTLMEKEQEDIERRATLLEGYKNGTIQGRVIPKPDDREYNNNSHEPQYTHNTRSEQVFLRASDKKYSKMFGSPQVAHEFRSFSDFATAIRMGDTKLLNTYKRAAHGSIEGIGSSGGFFVPEQFAQPFIDKTIEESVILPGVALYPMETQVINIPGWDNADHTSGIFGGISASWVAEAQNNNEQIPKAKSIQISAKMLAIFAAASQELAQDSPTYESSLQEGLQKAAIFKLDDAFINGTGAGMPLGILRADSLITITKETGQSSATILFENVSKMLARLHPACWNEAVWVAHPSTLPQLLALYIPMGVGGEVPSQYSLFAFNNGQYSLMGKPVYFSEKCKQLGTKGDLILVDRSQYIVGLRRQIGLEMTQHLYFKTIENAYRATMRVDGLPAWSQAITPANGTDTLSWAIAIEDR